MCTNVCQAGSGLLSAIGAELTMPTSRSDSLPFTPNTVWSTVIEPPISGFIPPIWSYCLRKFTASAPPNATKIASMSLGISASTAL